MIFQSSHKFRRILAGRTFPACSSSVLSDKMLIRNRFIVVGVSSTARLHAGKFPRSICCVSIRIWSIHPARIFLCPGRVRSRTGKRITISRTGSVRSRTGRIRSRTGSIRCRTGSVRSRTGRLVAIRCGIDPVAPAVRRGCSRGWSSSSH